MPLGPVRPAADDAIGAANAAVAGAVAQGVTPPPAPPASIAREAPPPPAPPPSMADVAGAARDVVGQRAADDLLRGTKRVFVPGSPGVDPHRMRAQGVAVPTTSNTVTEAGAPYDPEQARERIGAAKQVRDADLAGMELQAQQTANQLASQRALAPKLEQEAAIAQESFQRMQAAYKVDRSRLQRELDDYEKRAHVEPDRFFRDRGLFATIGMAIAQGMGAYASAMTGAPNFAYEMVQKAIDRDIAAQRDEIEAGRVSRRNKLAFMMDSYGYDLPQAEAAMRIAMNKSADNQAQMFAAESKLPQYAVEAQKYNAMTQQELIKQEQALYNASIGKQTRTQSEAFVQPKAATGGGYVERELTPEEMKGRLALLPKDSNVDFGELSHDKQADLVKEYGIKRQLTANVKTAADEVAATYYSKKDGKPLRIDWKRGALVDSSGAIVTEDEVDVPGDSAVGVDTDSVANRNRVKAARDARNRFANASAFEVFGAATPDQIESLKPSLFGTDERGAYRGLLNSVKKTTENERLLETAFPSEVTQANRSRDVQTMRERKGTTPVKVNPY